MFLIKPYHAGRKSTKYCSVWAEFLLFNAHLGRCVTDCETLARARRKNIPDRILPRKTGIIQKTIGTSQNSPLTSRCQGLTPQKRIAFSLFPPFNFLFSEQERKSQCQQNQRLTKIRGKHSTSVPTDDPWFALYKVLKPFLFTAFRPELT